MSADGETTNNDLGRTSGGHFGGQAKSNRKDKLGATREDKWGPLGRTQVKAGGKSNDTGGQSSDTGGRSTDTAPAGCTATVCWKENKELPIAHDVEGISVAIRDLPKTQTMQTILGQRHLGREDDTKMSESACKQIPAAKCDPSPASFSIPRIAVMSFCL